MSELEWMTLEELSVRTGLSKESIEAQFDRAMVIVQAKKLYPDFPISKEFAGRIDGTDYR